MSPRLDPELERLAAAHGVATWYRDGERRVVRVDAEVVVRVLGLLEIEAATAADVRRELGRVDTPGPVAPPPTLTVTTGTPPTGTAPAGTATTSAPAVPGAYELTGEDGSRRTGRELLPADLEPGWYRLETAAGTAHTVIAAPAALPPVPSTWGWMLQLYALRSPTSWGIGDLGDLREFVRWTAREHGAGAVLLNPLHAPGPTHPVQPSPYTPSSRRCATPLALRISDLPAYRRADPATRAEVDALAVAPDTARIDPDLVWAAKRGALELLWRAEGRPDPASGAGPPAAPRQPSEREYALWCALAERHGGRWSAWPAALHDPSSAAVTRAGRDLAPRVAFHTWVQRQCAAQLAGVRAAAREAGMAIGVLHDLAVGVDPEGADAWALADVLADGVTVGAPPDAFTPHGQNWGLPPWRPDRLAATGYAAYRDLLRCVLAHSDGLRIDHVAGLWRLWWVPPGEGPDRGTYVRYDADAMLAALTLEASRAGAVVVGEDLGTVEPEVTRALEAREMLGCAVSWFLREPVDGRPLAAARWPERAAASISTHDLPTAAGFLRGAHVTARAELGLLDDPPAEAARAAVERAELLTALRREGLLPGDPDRPANAGDTVANGDTVADGDTEAEAILAMHRRLAASPCRLKLVSPYDVLAEERQPNLPGTVEQYPNWRLPLPVDLEGLRADERVAATAALFDPERARSRPTQAAAD